MARVASQVVEEAAHLRCEALVGGEQTHVLVEACRHWVVVARARVDVAAYAASLLADHQAQLRVRLEPDDPVHHVTPGLLEEACPSNVALLVEASLDLDEHHDLLASGGGAHEGIHD